MISGRIPIGRAAALLLVAVLASACADEPRSVDRSVDQGSARASSGAAAIALAAAADLPDETPCPIGQRERICDTASHVCVSRGPVGPREFWGCVPVPGGCEADRSCACLGPKLCRTLTPMSTCVDTPHPNTILCESGYQ